MSAQISEAAQPLHNWERVGLVLLFVAIVAFGGIVEMRSAFLQRRMTDADDYFRAAWAVRTGGDIYSSVDTNGWHYNYPPLFAILIAPFANPPPGAERAGYLPYPVSVGIWYVLSVICFLLAIHWLASTLERHSPRPVVRWSRGWWWLRSGTLLMCLMAAGRTLSRGQSNMIVLICFVGMIALLLGNRPFRSGLWLSGPICIKLYPLFLLSALLVRREWRWLGGALCGAVFGLVLVPLLVFGMRGMMQTYARYSQVLLRPALGLGTDGVRDYELTGAGGTDSQSFVALANNFAHPTGQTQGVPYQRWMRVVHWTLSAAFAGSTLAAGVWTRRTDTIGTTLFFGALIVVMLPISPVCHIHYFIFAMPLVMGLLAAMWERVTFPNVEPVLIILLVINVVLNVLAALPGFERWKQFGVTLGATLLLWAAGIFELLRAPRIKSQLKPAIV